MFREKVGRLKEQEWNCGREKNKRGKGGQERKRRPCMEGTEVTYGDK